MEGSNFDAWLTSDEKTILYSHLERGSGLKIYIATRASENDAFGPGNRLPDVNLNSEQRYQPAMTEDRLTLFFVASGALLSVSTRQSGADPFSLGGRTTMRAYSSRTDAGHNPRPSPRGIYYQVKTEGQTKQKLFFDEKDRPIRLQGPLRHPRRSRMKHIHGERRRGRGRPSKDRREALRALGGAG